MRAGSSGYRFDRFVLDLDRGCLLEGGREIDLRPKAFEVLRRLAESDGRLVSKDELVQAVWPNVFVNEDALAQCVSDIRKALKDEDERFIKTIPRRGYRFVAEAVPLEQGAAPAAPEAAPAKPPARSAATLGLGAAAVAAVLIAFAAWSGGWFAGKPPAPDARLTIAVLPFANVGENPGEDWLGDGIAEDILTAVSRFRDLTVIARNSSFRYRGDAVDPLTAGRELNADFLLQGSVRRSGDQLRITAQLVDARTGAARWTERYDRRFADVFAIQDEVADSVAAQLVAHAREAAIARGRARPPETLEVYELVLRARKAYRTFTRDSTVEARALAERAIALDPNYAAAWEVLASALIQLYVQPYGEHQGSPAMLQQARAAAEKAVALDPNLATAHAALGFALVWARQYDASLEALRKAVSLNPNDASANSIYANVLGLAGEYREAIAAWERVERFDPFFPALGIALKAQAHVFLGEYEPALRLSRACAERAPRLLPCFLFFAASAKALGREDETREAVRRILAINPKFSVGRHMRLIPVRDEAAAVRLAAYLRGAGLPD